MPRARKTVRLRFATACAIVALALAAIPISECVLQCIDEARMLAMAFGDSEDSLERENEDASASVRDGARCRFNREVIDTESLSDFRATDDYSVVGFSMVGDASDVFETLSSSLVLRGWVHIESEADYAGSFIKEEGELNWIFVECVGFDADTSVVVYAR